MSALYNCPACQDCDNLTLPSVEFDDCLPEVYESEVTDVFIAKEDPLNPGQPATGSITWSDAAGIEAAFDGVNGLRLTVIGDKPAAESNTQTISKRRVINLKKLFTLNFTVDETNDSNYEALRKFECGGEYYLWFATLGGKVFGGPDGIKGNVMSADPILERGEGSFERHEYVFQWRASCSPPREDYALAENNGVAA